MPKYSKGMRQKLPLFRAGSEEGLHTMGSKRLRTVIQTDESWSPKPSWAHSEAWAVLKAPDQLSILERSCKHGLCTDLLMQSCPPRDKSISCVINWHPNLPLRPSLTPAACAAWIQNITNTSWYVGVCEASAVAAEGNCWHLEGPTCRWLFLSLTASCAQGRAPLCLCQQASGSVGWSRGFLGAGGDVARPTAYSAVQRKWDDTMLLIQQHSPSHKPWPFLLVRAVRFAQERSGYSFPTSG